MGCPLSGALVQHVTPLFRKDHCFSRFESVTILPLVPTEQEEEAFQGMFGKLTAVAGYVAVSSRSCENPVEPGLAGTCRHRFHFNQEASVWIQFTETYFHYPVHNRNLSSPGNWLCAVRASALIVPSTLLGVASLVVKIPLG